MYLTLDENQRMARAAEADSMQSHHHHQNHNNHNNHNQPAERKRSSLNGYMSGNSSRQSAAPSRPNPVSLSNVVYWPSRAGGDDEDPASLDVNSMTHLIYTAATVDHDGTIRLCDESPNFGTDPSSHQSSLEACVALKSRNPNLLVLVSVGGAAPSTHCLNYVAANDRLSRAFGKAARSFASKYEVDGFELDWSSASNEEEAERFLKLTATAEGYLGPDFSKRSYKLCIALPGTGPLLGLANLREAHKLVDLINIKAFNYLSKEAGHSTFHAQAFDPASPSCENTINAIEAKGANMRKVVLGVPCFGKAFHDASAPFQPFRESSEILYKKLPLLGTQVHVDLARGGAYCTGEVTDVATNSVIQVFVSYDLPETIALKANLVRDRGLGGLCFWTGAGDKVGEGSLIRSGYLALQGATNGG